MSGKKRTEGWDRTVKVAADQLKPMAAQVKPLAQSTGEAARRGILRTRAWAAPQVERSGQVLQDTVAPKVSAMLSSAAQRIDPAKPRRDGRWRLPVGIAAAIAAAASAAAAFLGNRKKTGTTMPADTTDTLSTGTSPGASTGTGTGTGASPDSGAGAGAGTGTGTGTADGKVRAS
jgi:hypothetical protein